VWIYLITPSQQLRDEEMSPFNQFLPNCSEDYPKIEKKTTAKAVLCPMIK
jgi:hypothetical protein